MKLATKKKTTVKKKAAATKKAAAKKPARIVTGRAAIKKKASAGGKKALPAKDVLDLSGFPPELIKREERFVCLACVLDVMTRHLGLDLKRAQKEAGQYSPTLDEVRATALGRPYFEPREKDDACPHCGSPSKWRARIPIIRIENSKSTQARRRELLSGLPEKSFAVLEEKATQQHAFFEWAEKISATLDLEDPRWLKEVARHYLGRKEPKVDWAAEFANVYSIRRSRRLEEGWEVDHGRLFLAPFVFDELLLVQYLVSRAHRAGGLTLEGRYTLQELFARLRNSGYLRWAGVEAYNPSDAFEQLVSHLGGGDSLLRYYYVVDRRDLVERVKALQDARVPKAKLPAART